MISVGDTYMNLRVSTKQKTYSRFQGGSVLQSKDILELRKGKWAEHQGKTWYTLARVAA